VRVKLLAQARLQFDLIANDASSFAHVVEELLYLTNTIVLYFLVNMLEREEIMVK
jgi:hypothetical protein